MAGLFVRHSFNINFWSGKVIFKFVNKGPVGVRLAPRHITVTSSASKPRRAKPTPHLVALLPAVRHTRRLRHESDPSRRATIDCKGAGGHGWMIASCTRARAQTWRRSRRVRAPTGQALRSRSGRQPAQQSRAAPDWAVLPSVFNCKFRFI